MKLQKRTLNQQLLLNQHPQNPFIDYNPHSINPNTSFKKLSSHSILINYDHIIQKQSFIIENLYKQCLELRQTIHKIKSQHHLIANLSTVQSLPQKNIQKFTKQIEHATLKQIAQILQITEQQISKSKVIQSIKRLLWEKQKRAEPIFIESKKQVRVPVPVQVIVQKPVQKIIIKERVIVKQKFIEVGGYQDKDRERQKRSGREGGDKIDKKIDGEKSSSSMGMQKSKHNSRKQSMRIENQKQNSTQYRQRANNRMKGNQSDDDMFLPSESVIKSKNSGNFDSDKNQSEKQNYQQNKLTFPQQSILDVNDGNKHRANNRRSKKNLRLQDFQNQQERQWNQEDGDNLYDRDIEKKGQYDSCIRYNNTNNYEGKRNNSKKNNNHNNNSRQYQDDRDDGNMNFFKPTSSQIYSPKNYTKDYVKSPKNISYFKSPKNVNYVKSPKNISYVKSPKGHNNKDYDRDNEDYVYNDDNDLRNNDRQYDKGYGYKNIRQGRNDKSVYTKNPQNYSYDEDRIIDNYNRSRKNSRNNVMKKDRNGKEYGHREFQGQGDRYDYRDNYDREGDYEDASQDYERKYEDNGRYYRNRYENDNSEYGYNPGGNNNYRSPKYSNHSQNDTNYSSEAQKFFKSKYNNNNNDNNSNNYHNCNFNDNNYNNNSNHMNNKRSNTNNNLRKKRHPNHNNHAYD